MQNVENDMDDLFKRAAENYPLQPGNGDWENIVKRITDQSKPSAIAEPVKNKANVKIIALLVLFILSFGGFWLHNFNAGSANIAVTKQTKIKNNQPEIKNNSGVRSTRESFTISTGKSEKNNFGKKIVALRGHHRGKLIAGINYATYQLVETSKKGKPADADIPGNPGDNTNFSPGVNLKNRDNTLLEKARHTGDEMIINEIDRNGDGIGIEPKKQLKKGNALEATGKKKKETHAMPPERKGIYVGLLMGPDFSKVRSASFNNTGFDASLVIEFRLNKKLSVGTGIGLNRKNYHSEGKMFKMDKVGSTMPSGMIINTLESQSSLIEIPVKITTDFINSRKSVFFMSGGISAYIMTKEKNRYNVTLNGTPEKLTGVYEKNDYRLPAVIDIAIGYEHAFYKNTQLRIEPFLKIPLQGMGVGSLPVTSAGLQVGLTRRLK